MSQQIEYRTLPEILEQGIAAFSHGRFPQAAHTFAYLRQNYQEEPEWLDGSLPSKILPIEGFAAFKSDNHSQAIAALELFLENRSPAPSDTQHFAQYALALSYQKSGQTDQARTTLQALRSSAADTHFADLASLRIAQLSPTDSAITLLTVLAATSTHQTFRNLADLELAKILLDSDQPARAATHIQSLDTANASFSQLALHSQLAFRLADSLLDSDPATALALYRSIVPYPELLAAQQARIASLEATIRDRAPLLSLEQNVWADFYADTLQTLRAQLAALREIPSYDPPLALRKAHCFQSLNRPLEAWILLESLASPKNNDTAPAAHMAWIRTARSLRAWNAAALIAQEYLDRYPNRGDADQALYWIAQSQIDAADYPAALASLNTLLNHTQSTHLRATAHYLQGICYALQSHYPSALAAFDSAKTTAPETLIAGQATLWQGICQFDQSHFETAAQRFTETLAKRTWHSLHPEALLRLASTHYALQSFDSALENCTTWLARFPDFPQQDQLLLLKGDIHLELNETELALQSYQTVSDADPTLAFFANANAVSIFLDTRQPTEALTLIEQRESKPLPPEHAASLALLKVETFQQLRRTDEIPAIARTYIDRFAHLPQAEQIDPLIALATDNDPATLRHWIDQISFTEFPTLKARLIHRLAEVLHSQNQTHEAKRLTLQLAHDFPLETLPPECLATLGLELATIDSLLAPNYLNHCTKTYPNSEYTQLAHFALAQYHHSKNNLPSALESILQVDPTFIPQTYATESLLLKATLLSESHHPNQAIAAYTEVLHERSATPTQKSTALLHLGQLYRQTENPTAAYNCFQRLFTLFRSDPQAVATAYLQCIEILIELDRPTDAHSVCLEFLAEESLSPFPEYATAQTLLKTLAPLPSTHATL